MKLPLKPWVLLMLSLAFSLPIKAQCPEASTSCSPAVPHLVRFSGTLKSTVGLPSGGVVSIKFVLYADADSETPLWQEVQNVHVDLQGHYEVTLGTTSLNGIPLSLFTSGESRWLAVHPLLPGQDEQPRIMLVSVPYALQADNAQTLGGLPVSAFVRAAADTTVLSAPASGSAGGGTVAIPTSNAVSNQAAPQTASQTVTTSGGTLNLVPKFSSPSSIVNSQIADQNGMVTMQNLSNVLFADQFPGGVPDAVAACPANGCVIYAFSPNVNLSLGNIDPGYKAVTIYLGPYTFTVNQITLRKALKIIGMGAMGGVTGTTVTCSPSAPCNGTALQSVNGRNPVFVIPQTNNEPATNVLLSGFRIYGAPGNTSQDGILLDTSSSFNAGLWYSTIEDIYLQGFAGVAIHIKGRSTDFAAASQWLQFTNMVAYRNARGGNALKVEGATFQLRFANCEFDGQAIGDGTNIDIEGSPNGGSGYPISVSFDGLVSQQAALAVHIDGAVNITFHNSHHESLWGVYQVTSNNMPVLGLNISDSYFAGNVGNNNGYGFLLNVATPRASGIVFSNNHVFGGPDNIVVAVNSASITYKDNLSYYGATRMPPTSGISTQMSPATTIDIQGVHSVGLNPSTTPISTVQSMLGPGEMVTFFSLGGPVTFSAGGNIDLMGGSTLTVNGTITFVRTDLGGLYWKPVSQWSPSQ